MSYPARAEQLGKYDMHNPASVLENEIHKLLWDFDMQTDYQILVRWLDLKIINKRNWTSKIDRRIKLKESKKKDKYLDLAKEWKKLWNMKVTIIPTVIIALVTVTKRLVQGREDFEIWGRVETIQTTA